MSRSLIYLVAGARPNFMKIAPIVRALQARADRFGAQSVGAVDERALVTDTGQDGREGRRIGQRPAEDQHAPHAPDHAVGQQAANPSLWRPSRHLGLERADRELGRTHHGQPA